MATKNVLAVERNLNILNQYGNPKKKSTVIFVIVLSSRCSFHITPRNTCTSMLVITVALIFDYLCFKCNLLLLCGDVELNPGLKQNSEI